MCAATKLTVPMKPSLNSPENPSPLLAIGAHPDDIEFGAGGIVIAEAMRGRPVHLVLCSRGESGTNGTPDQREAEARAAADLMGASLEFVDLGGDANIENTRAGARKIAQIIRRIRPGGVLSPTVVENQHPDHAAVGRMTRDATRLAHYGGVAELKDQPCHVIDQLLFYVIGADAEPNNFHPVIYPLADDVVARWQQVMRAHASQMATRDYVEFQVARARLIGQTAGVDHAMALYPNDPLVISSLDQIEGSSRHF